MLIGVIIVSGGMIAIVVACISWCLAGSGSAPSGDMCPTAYKLYEQSGRPNRLRYCALNYGFAAVLLGITLMAFA